ncbi:hypothetical protein EBZ80_17095 [bacterium]|nr:hypothetical protein [bacterium]
MNNIDNIEHSLRVINEVGVKADDALEKKKIEVTATAGGVAAANEVVRTHKEFMDKSKADLAAKVKEGKMTAEVAQLIMSIAGQSHDVLKKFLTDKTAQHNVKKGEAVALDGNVKLLKSTYDSLVATKAAILAAKKEEELKKQEAQSALEPPSFVPMFSSELVAEPPKKSGRSKKRPDEVGPLAETVKRIKKSRKKG